MGKGNLWDGVGVLRLSERFRLYFFTTCWPHLTIISILQAEIMTCYF